MNTLGKWALSVVVAGALVVGIGALVRWYTGPSTGSDPSERCTDTVMNLLAKNLDQIVDRAWWVDGEVALKYGNSSTIYAAFRKAEAMLPNLAYTDGSHQALEEIRSTVKQECGG